MTRYVTTRKRLDNVSVHRLFSSNHKRVFLICPSVGGGVEKKTFQHKTWFTQCSVAPPGHNETEPRKTMPFSSPNSIQLILVKKKKKKATLVEREGIGTRVPSERPSPSLRERLSLGFGRNIDGWRGGAVGSTQRCRGQARFRRREPGCVLARRTRPIYIYL